jgi:NitT/TauT family transport system ATP-binding protein
MLQASHDRRLERDVAHTALELDFPAEVAARQLETLVNWGRYTELLAYDDTRDVFYLEPAGATPVGAGHSGTTVKAE